MKIFLRLSLLFTLYGFLTIPAGYAKQNHDQLTRESIADSYVIMQRFAEAGHEYLTILSDKSIDLLTYDRVNLKMASTLHYTRKHVEAEKRFGAVIVRNIAAFTPQFACDYVNTLIRMEKLQRAAEVASRFNRESATYRSYQPLQNLIDGLKRSSAIHSMTTASIEKAPFNMSGSNFWSAPYKGGIMFIHNDSNEAAMLKGAEFYHYDGQKSVPYRKVPKTMQTGPASFTNDGKTILYTDNRYKENQFVRLKKEDAIAINYLNIVELSYDEKSGQWENPKSIFANKPFSSMCHPSISEDGQRLYFAADFSDGKGSMDIYMSRRTTKGWGEPVSLGLAVNTKDSELYPNVHGNILSFSSNGHTGSGGMDIYSVELADDGLPVTETLVHLPYPINTIYNDYALMYNPGGEGGYFTSDRPNGKSLDLIYSWVNRVEFAVKNPLMESAKVVSKSVAFTNADKSLEKSGSVMTSEAVEP